jgi:hypothetical protein
MVGPPFSWSIDQENTVGASLVRPFGPSVHHTPARRGSAAPHGGSTMLAKAGLMLLVLAFARVREQALRPSSADCRR